MIQSSNRIQRSRLDSFMTGIFGVKTQIKLFGRDPVRPTAHMKELALANRGDVEITRAACDYKPSLLPMRDQTARNQLFVSPSRENVYGGMFAYDRKTGFFYPWNAASFHPALMVNGLLRFSGGAKKTYVMAIPLIDIAGKTFLGLRVEHYSFAGGTIRFKQKGSSHMVAIDPAKTSKGSHSLDHPIDQISVVHESGRIKLIAETPSDKPHVVLNSPLDFPPAIRAYFDKQGSKMLVALQIRSMFLGGEIKFTRMHFIHAMNPDDGSQALEIRIVQ